MEPNKKRTVITVSLAVVLTILLVGGGTYWAMARTAARDKENLENQLHDLQSQLNNQKATPTPSPIPATPSPSSSPTATPSAAPKATSMTKQSIENRIYKLDGVDVTLKNGDATYTVNQGTAKDGSPVKSETTAALSNSLAADMNGDGVAEGVAVIYVHYQDTTGSFPHVFSLVPKIGAEPTVTELVMPRLVDRDDVKSLTFKDGKVVFDLLVHGPNDGACCPSVQKTQYFTLEGTDLVESGVSVTGAEKTINQFEDTYVSLSSGKGNAATLRHSLLYDFFVTPAETTDKDLQVTLDGKGSGGPVLLSAASTCDQVTAYAIVGKPASESALTYYVRESTTSSCQRTTPFVSQRLRSLEVTKQGSEYKIKNYHNLSSNANGMFSGFWSGN